MKLPKKAICLPSMNFILLRTKYEARPEELQTAKFKMYASVVMVTTFPYQQVIRFIVTT